MATSAVAHPPIALAGVPMNHGLQPERLPFGLPLALSSAVLAFGSVFLLRPPDAAAPASFEPLQVTPTAPTASSDVVPPLLARDAPPERPIVALEANVDLLTLTAR